MEWSDAAPIGGGGARAFLFLSRLAIHLVRLSFAVARSIRFQLLAPSLLLCNTRTVLYCTARHGTAR